MRRHQSLRALGTESGLVVVERGAARAGIRVLDAREQRSICLRCRSISLAQWVLRRDASAGSRHETGSKDAAPQRSAERPGLARDWSYPHAHVRVRKTDSTLVLRFRHE